ncbi:MAG: hypothetical protein Q9210_005438 [Variospora velana]
MVDESNCLNMREEIDAKDIHQSGNREDSPVYEALAAIESRAKPVIMPIWVSLYQSRQTRETAPAV